MGEAKRRGTPEERAQQAQARVDALRPQQLVCGACKTAFKEFEALEAPGLRGIDAIFGGQCPNCGNDVLVFKGESKAVAEAMLAYEKMMGEGTKLGYQHADGTHVAFDATAPQASDASDKSTPH
ncbi:MULTISPECIES: hypothetical protein [Cupriavidus]|uniref:Uncharacterized protein n=1 Tax=Cupriavidus pauculus TaxID=82633 RepID=A0A5P2HCR3_9BURK|nr:hypothetical protein [Cupriavidus pauculus]QET05578.1 hypothetical protein FOB72_26630 [Cupriavidus pauculus]